LQAQFCSSMQFDGRVVRIGGWSLSIPQLLPTTCLSTMLPTIVDRPSKTCYSTLYFPNGVAVEKFNRYGEARRKLKEKCPIYVDKLLAAEGLMEEYDALIDDFIRTGAD